MYTYAVNRNFRGFLADYRQFPLPCSSDRLRLLCFRNESLSYSSHVYAREGMPQTSLLSFFKMVDYHFYKALVNSAHF